MRRAVIFLVLPLVALGCSRTKRLSEDHIEVASNTYVVVTKDLHPGTIEASVKTSLGIRWPSRNRIEPIASADYYEGKEDIRLVGTKKHHIVVYGRSLYVRPVDGGKWFWWPPQNALTSPPPPNNSIASYLKDSFEDNGWTNFIYEADGQYHEERITFSVPDRTEPFTIGGGQNGAWRTMPYQFDSADEQANAVTYATDIPLLPRFLVFVGPPNYFGAWSFDRNSTERKNKGPNQSVDHYVSPAADGG